MILDSIAESLLYGKASDTQALVMQALSEGISPESVLKDGLERGIAMIGERFERREIFAPELMQAVRTMNVCLRTLTPLMTDTDTESENLQNELREHNKNLANSIFNKEKTGKMKCKCARCRTLNV